MKGRVTLTSNRVTTPCVLVCQSYPSWIFVLGELGLTPKWILVRDPRHAEVMARVAPAECKIFNGSAREMSKLLGAHPGVKLGLVDGAITTDLSALFEGVGVNTVYYTQRMRRKLPGWDNYNFQIEHWKVGGVTLRTMRFGVLGKVPLGRPTVGPPLAPRDVSTVLDCMAQHYSVRKAPPSRHLPDGVCENLGNLARPVYHGGGWLPAEVTPKTRILTPGVYAPKGTWVLRPLTFSEYLSAHDVPEALIRILRDDVPLGSDPSLTTMVPGKCLVAGFRFFNGGGTASFSEKDGGEKDGGEESASFSEASFSEKDGGEESARFSEQDGKMKGEENDMVKEGRDDALGQAEDMSCFPRKRKAAEGDEQTSPLLQITPPKRTLERKQIFEIGGGRGPDVVPPRNPPRK
jgi:hypothetical protein